jgi:hypothetical protein
MLIDGIAGITLIGGLSGMAVSNSALITLNPVVVLRPDPNTIAGGQQFISSGLLMAPTGSVIHSAEVSINDPITP